MLIGVGVDLMDVARMEAERRDGGAGFLADLFTDGEIAYCADKLHPAEHLAARFAAKEAFFKAFGVDGKRGHPWREVEVVNAASGRPEVRLHGGLRAEADERRIKAIHLSLSHTRELAVAQLILES